MLVAQLAAGDAFKIRSGGGGGHGSPLERPIAQVLHDVRQGYVTVKAAADLYGVVIDSATLELDISATKKRRAALKKRNGRAGDHVRNRRAAGVTAHD